MLEIKDLSVNLNSEIILNGISFQVRPGEMLVIIGPNGAGKTTLLRAICGLIPIAQGEVILDHQNLNNKTSFEKAKLIAALPQIPVLPAAFTVWDVVQMGRTPYLNWLGQTSPKDDEIVRTALRQTQTYGFAQRKIGELSAGEQQRVLLARALAQDTPVLLMDEPTTHLDLRYQIELLDLIRQLVQKKNITSLIVLHDLNLASRYADTLILLDQGKIAAFGKPRQVLTEPMLSRVYQLSIKVNNQRKIPHIFPE